VWDTRVRENLVQRAAEQCVTSILRPRRGLEGAAASPPALPLTASWLLRPNQGQSTLGKVLGGDEYLRLEETGVPVYCWSIPLQCRAPQVGRRACALCSHPAETQSHIHCLCPALKEALIQAHHNMPQRLWKGIEDSTNGWIIVKEQTVAGLQGLPQPEEQIDTWQRAWDKVTDELLNVRRCKLTPTWQSSGRGKTHGL
jgi:hypothetical protein